MRVQNTVDEEKEHLALLLAQPQTALRKKQSCRVNICSVPEVKLPHTGQLLSASLHGYPVVLIDLVLLPPLNWKFNPPSFLQHLTLRIKEIILESHFIMSL